MMIFSDRNNFALLLLCWLMISIYSINLHAQENGNESDSQLTISTESTQQADTQNAEKASEQDTKC